MSTQTVNLTFEQLQELMSKVVASAVAESKKLNPIEERKLKEQLEADRRRALLAVQLAKDETSAMMRKKYGCSHMADLKTGQPVQKGAFGGNWTTGGQVHSNGTITLVCLRCNWEWRFKATDAEKQYALDAEHGLLYFPPPGDERLLKEEEQPIVAVA